MTGSSRWFDVHWAVLVLLVVLVAVWLRATGFDWDRRRLLHPDERFLVMTTATLSLPDNLASYLDASRSPLNPRRPDRPFAYGTLPLTVTRVALAHVEHPTHAAIVMVGRGLGVLADMTTLLVLGWLARRLYDTRIAVLAMALYACAVLPIQHSHFFVVEPFLTLCCTLALAATAMLHARWHWGWAAAAGGAASLAIACKVTGVLVLGPLAAVMAASTLPTFTRDGVRAALRAIAPAAIAAGAVGLLVLRIAAPDMFDASWVPRPSARWLADMRTVARQAAGIDDLPPSFQWAHRPRIWYPWWNLVRFGLGPALGLTATCAAIAAFWLSLGDWRTRHFVPALWCALLGVSVGTQFVPAMRYLLPAYPMLCLLAAWALVALWRRAAPRHRWLRLATAGLAALVVVSTAAWALAFTAVYRELHPRLAASRWIFDTIPAGTVLTAEAWDDALPISASIHTHASRYTILTLPVTDEDTPAKVDVLVDALDRAEYVVLSSGRNADMLPRLPARFPVMVRYYDALRDGRLGFDLVREFSVTPRLGRVALDDATAEEAFTVYDHPHVRIYRKHARWSARAARALLSDVDWLGIVRTSAVQASRAPGLLALSEARREALDVEGSWRSGPHARFASPRHGAAAVAAWMLMVLIVAILAWPACSVLLPHAWGRGALVAPALGLLWISWAVWMAGSLWPGHVTYGVLVAAVASTGLVSTALVWPQRDAWLRRLRIERWLLARHAGAFALACLAGIALRAINPDLWHPVLGGEKPMDIALLTALVRADGFPVADPWFAGGVLNYYYGGYLPVAVLCRLVGVEPAVGYTLAVGTWWAMTAGGVAVVAGTLVAHLHPRRRVWPWALLGAALGVVAGNLRQMDLLWRYVRGHAVETTSWFWHASRAIPAPAGEALPITEFPFFTFLFADLHAHLLSMPWLLALLLVAGHAAVHARLTVGVALGGLILGMLASTNAWDAPGAFLLLSTALCIGVWHRSHHASPLPHIVRRCLVLVGGLCAVAVVASWPFWSVYVSPAGGVGVWRGSRSAWWALLAVHGPFLLVLLPAAAIVRRADRWRGTAASAWIVALVVAGVAYVAAAEVVVVRGDVGRMNTVFKTYLLVWLLWSTAVPAAWLVAYTWLAEHHRRRANAFVVVTTMAGVAMLAYPATAMWPRLALRMAPDAPRGVDGTAFMPHATLQTAAGSFDLGDDHAVIRWLLDTAVGTPVVAEAQTDQYQWGGRISAHTGLPTILGWTWHARQQRAALPVSLVARRWRDVRRLYGSRSSDEAWRIARRYDVTYLVVGHLERQTYPAEGLDKFAADPRWQRVFRSGTTDVYERIDARRR
ncbi:MAG: glycosyltransferase family 39 protein [Acidobacteria bacterium]|nr:glycosyltransferase family 39 protein [Acidobacteriota bacterium]